MGENVQSTQSGSASELKDIDPKQIDDIVGYVEEGLASVNHCVFPTNPEQRCIRPVADPQLLRIGLFQGDSCLHDGKGDEIKMTYLEKFLKRIKKRATIKDLVHLILNDLRRVKDYYDSNCIDKSLRSDRDFVDRILRDAAFIIELFLRDYKREIIGHENNYYSFFSEPWRKQAIQYDLITAQNQLPLFILKDVYDRAFAAADDFVPPDFMHLTCHFFRRYRNQNISIRDNISASHLRHHQPKHFTDFLRAILLPYSLTEDHRSTEERLEADQEQDVDLLVRRRIIINQLGSNEAAVTLFNNLRLHNAIRVEKNHFSSLFTKINAYNAILRHSWMATLRLQYFSNPWRSLATVAAVILLLLTLIQTICSVISIT
ncbi:hypothetical protein PTKIN_Ptkin14bG0231300 [Pterospermum kingtungense]